jgi:hypothetical protein
MDSVLGWEDNGILSVNLSVFVSECESSTTCLSGAGLEETWLAMNRPRLPLIGGNQTVQTHAKNYPVNFTSPFAVKVSKLCGPQIYHNEALPCPVKPSGSGDILCVRHSTNLQAERK